MSGLSALGGRAGIRAGVREVGTVRKREANAPAAEESGAILRLIGQRLRALRQERGLSLAQVAAAAGLTRGFLSQLELGDTAASVSSLVKIASALGVEVTSLFERPPSPLVRHAELKPSMLGGVGLVDYLLTPAGERRAQMIETHLEPGGHADTGLFARNGELVICHVVSGTLAMEFDGEHCTLGTGDTITFDPKVPHNWSNPSKRYRTKVIWVEVPAEY
jgi:transcriptional regulator with XRE-family HTH domain